MLLNKTQVAEIGNIISSYWQRHSLPLKPQTLQDISNVTSYHTHLENKTHLQQDPHMYGPEYRDIYLVLNWRLHPYKLTFIVLQGKGHYWKRKVCHPAMNPHIYNTDLYVRHVSWLNWGKNDRRVDSHFWLDVRPAFCTITDIIKEAKNLKLG